jgi:hypothetical protein
VRQFSGSLMSVSRPGSSWMGQAAGRGRLSVMTDVTAILCRHAWTLTQPMWKWQVQTYAKCAALSESGGILGRCQAAGWLQQPEDPLIRTLPVRF